MISDIDSFAHRATLDADVVVVGAGAAGITLALALNGSSLKVVVLESGTFEFTEAIQALYRGAIVGRGTEDPAVSRLRFFGGSTNHWAGWCRPLEPGDFSGRPDWPDSAWPFGREALDAYYREAAALCELGPDRFDDLEYWRARSGRPLTPFALDPERLRTAVFQVSPPTRFGEAYRDELARSTNVEVILAASALRIEAAAGTEPGQARKTVAGVSAGSLSGRRLAVRGRVVVLAVGGLETARLLLLSRDVFPAGAGNEHDLVGRFFLDHPWMRGAAYLRFSGRDNAWPLYFDEHEIAGARLFGAVSSTPAALRREAIGAFRFAFLPSTVSTLGTDSLDAILGGLGEGRVVDDFAEHLGNVAADLDWVADAAWRKLLGAKSSPFVERSSDDIRGAVVDLNFEQRPNRDSRVRLDAARDAFGDPRVALDWRLSETDRRTADRALELLALEMGRLGLGRLQRIGGMERLDEAWPPTLMGSRHHSGGARMSRDPTTGVTDGEGRVHSCANLYVAGSALFSTIGYANPTLTIVALALRQAQHLKQVLS